MERKFQIIGKSHNLLLFRNDLRHLLAASGLEEDKVHEVLIAVQEVLTNIVRHGYGREVGKIWVTYHEDPEQIRISIRDLGKKFNFTELPEPKLPRESPGGLGIHLIRNAVDEIDYDAAVQEGNLVHLVKYKYKEERGSL